MSYTPLEGLTIMDTPLEGWTIMDTPLEGWTTIGCMVFQYCPWPAWTAHTCTGYSRRSHAHMYSCSRVLCVYASIYIDQCYCMTEVTRAEECTQDMFIVGAGYA